MRVAVVGATGTAGSRIVAELERRGHEVRALSRGSATYPVDLLTGYGLDPALEGCAAVVDAANAGPKPAEARALLVEGGRRLLAAASAAGVRHHVCLSIIGIERVPLGYYRVKLEQEAVVMEADVPWSIVRASQFHQLLAEAFEVMARFRLTPRSPAPLQPVDPTEVATVVGNVLEGDPLQATTTVAGPEIRSITELSGSWTRSEGLRALPVRIPMLLGRTGRAISAGGLTTASSASRGEVTFERWLERRQG